MKNDKSYKETKPCIAEELKVSQICRCGSVQ